MYLHMTGGYILVGMYTGEPNVPQKFEWLKKELHIKKELKD